MTESVFQKVREIADGIALERRKRIQELREARARAESRKADFKTLELEGQEAQALLNDGRYTRQKHFLDSFKAHLQARLQAVCASDISREAQALRAARIAAQLELLDILLTRPEKIVSQWQKEENDKQKDNG